MIGSPENSILLMGLQQGDSQRVRDVIIPPFQKKVIHNLVHNPQSHRIHTVYTMRAHSHEARNACF